MPLRAAEFLRVIVDYAGLGNAPDSQNGLDRLRDLRHVSSLLAGLGVGRPQPTDVGVVTHLRLQTVTPEQFSRYGTGADALANSSARWARSEKVTNV